MRSVRERLRWAVWDLLSKKVPSVCVANSYYRIINKDREQTVKVDRVCHQDLAMNGVCWCGKLCACTDATCHRVHPNGGKGTGEIGG